jgi:hypothetical protein
MSNSSFIIPHSSAAAWAAVVTAALVGTERQPGAVPEGAGALGALLARVDAADGPAALLSAAAALVLYGRAGWVPPTDPTPLPEAAPPDTQPRVTARAGEHLATMLAGQQTGALAEWLAAAGAGGWRVPEELLPDLLELGRGNPTLRAVIGPALGERGRWLAAQNPEWAYVGAADAALDVDTLWVTNVRGMRLALLGRLRATDPDGARERVAGTWGEESAEDRAAFLAAFRSGLRPSDEPFLEAALDDRRKEVRLAAADLLARLPESRLVGRMTERARPLLHYSAAQRTGMLKRKQRARIDLTLPDDCDKVMARDGIERKPATALLGEKAWWLRQMLGAVPLGVWTDTWGVTPAELVEAAVASDWKEVLIPGWAQAAERQRDAAWAAVLLPALPERLAEFQMSGLVPVLGAAQRETLALRLLADDPKPSQHTHPALFILEHHTEPWSAQLTRVVLNLARKRSKHQMSHTDYFGHYLLSQLGTYARYMDPALAGEAAQGWPDRAALGHYWTKMIDEFTTLLQFRHEMLKELTR